MSGMKGRSETVWLLPHQVSEICSTGCRQVQVFKTPTCSLKTRYCMGLCERIHFARKTIGVVKNKTLNIFEHSPSVQHDNSTIAHEPIRFVVGEVMIRYALICFTISSIVFSLFICIDSVMRYPPDRLK